MTLPVPHELISVAYRDASDTATLAESLREILAKYCSADPEDLNPETAEDVKKSLRYGIEAHRKAIQGGDSGALALAVRSAEGLRQEWPEWLRTAVQQWAVTQLYGDEPTGSGRHARVKTRAEDIAAALGTYAVYHMVKFSNEEYGRRSLGTALEITAAVECLSGDAVKKRIAIAKKMGGPETLRDELTG